LIPGLAGSDLLRRVRTTHTGNPGKAGVCGAEVGRHEVAEENAGALALYDRLGFARHHRYHYTLAPSS